MASYHDVPFHISVEIGNRKFKVRDLMNLAPNSIVQLRKPAGEPLDICINGHHLASGEVIAVGQTCGVRITEILKPAAADKKAGSEA